MSLCKSCMKRNAVIKYCTLCRPCYYREWRKSQGPGSKYRVRAAISSIKRSGEGRVCGEVHAVLPEQLGAAS